MQPCVRHWFMTITSDVQRFISLFLVYVPGKAPQQSLGPCVSWLAFVLLWTDATSLDQREAVSFALSRWLVPGRSSSVRRQHSPPMAQRHEIPSLVSRGFLLFNCQNAGRSSCMCILFQKNPYDSWSFTITHFYFLNVTSARPAAIQFI